VQGNRFLLATGSKEFKHKRQLVLVQMVLHTKLLCLAQVELKLANHQNHPGDENLGLSSVVLVNIGRSELEVDCKHCSYTNSFGELIHVQTMDCWEGLQVPG
jgi:hypothetical protein